MSIQPLKSTLISVSSHSKQPQNIFHFRRLVKSWQSVHLIPSRKTPIRSVKQLIHSQAAPITRTISVPTIKPPLKLSERSKAHPKSASHTIVISNKARAINNVQIKSRSFIAPRLRWTNIESCISYAVHRRALGRQSDRMS